ncbi:sortase [Streptomyces sp. NPDC056222]|uniref:sortase n=1 Tax=Streptomyces sp. NPDC056222 TaxID=3345749 RepID=UPI0035DB36DB
MRLARRGLPVALIVVALTLSAPTALAAEADPATGAAASWDPAAGAASGDSAAGTASGDSATGTASAGDSAAGAAGEATGTVRINPRKAFPGSTVTVSTTACGKETYGKGESEVGGKFHLLPGDRKGVLVGEFKVPEDAASGTDTVTLKCPPRIKQTVTYHISGRPNGAVDAGFGWAAGAEGNGGTGDQLALGALLLGGALAGGVARMRRRSAGAGTSA